jgi:uncharacterized LabA/DUF88 family protein
MDNRTAVLIDGAYLGIVSKQFSGPDGKPPKLDFVKLTDSLVARIPVPSGAWRWRTYFYDSDPREVANPTPAQRQANNGKKDFLKRLEGFARFQVRRGKLELRGQNEDGSQKFEQKRVDVMLAVDMVRLAFEEHVEFIILVAGDSDFVPAIEAARAAGVTVILYYGGPTKDGFRQTHDELRLACDESVQIDRSLIEANTRT